MSQFYTSETSALEKEVELHCECRQTPEENLENTYELNRCAHWIKTNNFNKVCLQFPDHLLGDSSQIALFLQKKVGQTVYILADTSYEPCCIDYIAAAHIDSDAIIHFGPVCFSKTSAQIAFLYVYEKEQLDIEQFSKIYSELLTCSEQNPIVLLDTGFIHLLESIYTIVPEENIVTIVSDDFNLENKSVLFIAGQYSTRKLPNLKFSYKVKNLYYYQNNSNSLCKYETDAKILRRRYFLAEKILDSNTVGIVIGTLGVKNYLQVLDRLKTLLKLHKKKYYLVSVGKPTVAKLANFPEIDIYVVVTCALNEIYDSRDFYKPIVTPFDIEMALNVNDTSFTYDYNDFLSNPIRQRDLNGDVSLITGNIRHKQEDDLPKNESTELAVRGEGTIALNTNYGAGYLHNRTWKGLEQNVGVGEVKMAEEGRIGVAQQYQCEMSKE